MMKFKQGLYVPKNPHKYLAENLDNIVYRSSWELFAFKRFDADIRIMCWASEPFPIPYLKPCPKSKSGFRPAKYYPDFYIEYIDENNKLRKVVLEIKPADQVNKPKGRKGKSRTFKENTYAINMQKWYYAELWCKKYGLEFKIMTERELFTYSL